MLECDNLESLSVFAPRHRCPPQWPCVSRLDLCDSTVCLFYTQHPSK